MAAAAIDGATKIWSYKVDAMHKEATQAVKGFYYNYFNGFYDKIFYLCIKIFKNI